MKPTDYLLSCDWGTTSFRLHLVRIADGAVLHQIDNGLGIKVLYANWQKSGKPSRLDFFLEYLDFRIYLLEKKAEMALDHVPVFISGMASSSIGLQELPYAKLPFLLSGRDLIYEQFEAATSHRADIFLWSGLCSPHDVMRGEESQLIGLAEYFPEKKGITILPGTHSKHIYVQDHQIVDFHTYMTGEFFALLSQHSILKNSVSPRKIDQFTDWTYFNQGVLAAQNHHLLSATFHVRTNELLHQIGPADNAQYLSGLLIGSELKELPLDSPIYLCGGNSLRAPYQKALDLLGHRQFTVIEASVVEGAVAKAHALYYRTLR